VNPAGNAPVAGRCAAAGGRLVEHYNNVRLNSAIGYITPKDMLAGRQAEIHAERDRKLEATRKQRQIRRQQAA
jgi:putative transposase